MKSLYMRPSLTGYTRAGQKLPRIRPPLRTYGKRASSTDTVEPALKKRRVEPISTSVSCEENAESMRSPSAPLPSPAPSLTQPPKKGTIMSYFKIVPPVLNRTNHPSEPSSKSIIPTNTPPSSPTPNLPRKKRRRLTTRVISRATSEDSRIGGETEADDDNGQTDTVDDESVLQSHQTDVLSNTSPDTLNRLPTNPKKLDAGGRGRGTIRGSKPATVQTTLSLAIDEKGFTECKECNMLYNPLHKQDAKFHARQHAAMLKAKSSIPDNETSD
ncbi:hypothetical protein GGS26DRAFT_513629 [Hypomontagnella submonticulosa]|nr:hypothetical protein GGS26DRAFT_513629 [Hypomontagnella submonticulosa]